jgi:hypothetical protein
VFTGPPDTPPSGWSSRSKTGPGGERILAASVIIWRTQVLPRWLCILGALEIALNAVELIGLSSRHGILAGGYVAGIGPFVYILWFAAASICTAARARRPHQPRAAQPR